MEMIKNNCSVSIQKLKTNRVLLNDLDLSIGEWTLIYLYSTLMSGPQADLHTGINT